MRITHMPSRPWHLSSLQREENPFKEDEMKTSRRQNMVIKDDNRIPYSYGDYKHPFLHFKNLILIFINI